MEIAGIVLIIAMVVMNALSFFKASDVQKRIYKITVADTTFNKSKS